MLIFLALSAKGKNWALLLVVFTGKVVCIFVDETDCFKLLALAHLVGKIDHCRFPPLTFFSCYLLSKANFW